MSLLRISVILSTLVFLISCNKDSGETPNEPTVFISPNFGDADVGGTMSTTIEIDAPGGFRSLVLTTIVDEVRDEANTVTISPAFSGQTDTTFTYTFTNTVRELAGATIDIEFLLTDNLDRSSNSLYRVGINEPSTLVNFGTNLTPPQSTDGVSNSTTFIGLGSSQTSWSVAQVNAETTDVTQFMDFGYYYDESTSSAIMASIFSYPIPNLGGMDTWTNRNQTTFRRTTLTAEDYDAARFRDIYLAYQNGTSETLDERISDLQVGDIIAFEMDSDKFGGVKNGIFHVLALQAGDGPNDFIQIGMKFED